MSDRWDPGFGEDGDDEAESWKGGGNGDPAGGQGTHDVSDPIVEALDALLRKFGPFVTVERQIRRYVAGAYCQIEDDELASEALKFLPPEKQTAADASKVLRLLKLRSYARPSTLRGYVYEDDEGLVWLCCRNGVLVLGPSGPFLTDHDPKYRFAAQLAAAYVPRADAPRLYSEIQHGALPDALDRAQVDMFGGYCLIPDCRLQTCLIPYGETGIGKSTLFSAHGACLGERLIGRISLVNLCGDTGFYLPTLRQFGLNIGRELKASGQKLPPLNADRLREIIDGCPIDVRRAHCDPIRLHHHTKFVFTSNEIPVLRGGNEADARRLRFCHFRVRPEQEDVTLEKRLAAERDSILSHILVPAACRILAGEKIPQGGQSSVGIWNRFRVLNDPLGAFAHDCCDLRTDSAVEKGRLYDRYVAWRTKVGQPSQERPDEFFKRLYARFGVSQTRPGSRGAREHWVQGIGLLDAPR